jgi:glycerol-1-phosphate dehydrogenase [NAD(P)+]
MAQNKTTYGDGILASEVDRLDDFVVATDEVAWRLYQGHFPRQPVQVLTPDTLEQSDLDGMASTMPEGVEIIGLGGGSAIDAAKYFAYRRGKTPILVPTITSSNAQFSDFISVRRQGRPFGFKKDGWPRQIIVDYDLIRTADARLNRAGYGDLLFLQTALNDWRTSAKTGKGPPVDPELEEDITEMMRLAMENASEIGSVSRQGIEVLMRLFEEYTKLIMANPSKPIDAGAEHLFAWNLEGVTARHFIHGEIVALGIFICSYLQKSHHNELKRALAEAEVAYRPSQIGVSWDEIEETLLTVNQYNREVRKLNTVFDQVDWTPELLSEIQKLVLALEEGYSS